MNIEQLFQLTELIKSLIVTTIIIIFIALLYLIIKIFHNQINYLPKPTLDTHAKNYLYLHSYIYIDTFYLFLFLSLFLYIQHKIHSPSPTIPSIKID